jgi:CBS domain-containing protein
VNEPAFTKPQPDGTYFLSEILGNGIYSTYDRSKRIGKLSDVIIVEKGTIPHVTELIISRPFGEPSLIIPIDKIVEIADKTIVVHIESIVQYEGKPAPDAMLLRDFVLDKKIIDTDDRDVSVVYDVKIIQINKKLYVSDVELNRYGLLKRIGLKWLADILKIKEDTVSWKYIQALPGHIGAFRGNVKLTTLREKLADIPPVDMADIIEELNQEQRALLLNEMEPEHASDAFEEVDPNVQREIVSSLDKRVIARLIDEMTPAQAADVLSALPYKEKESLFAIIKPDMSEKIRAIVNQQDEHIRNYLTTDYISFTVYDNVGKARSEYQAAAQGNKVRHYVYIVDSSGVLQGIIDVSELLTYNEHAMLRDIMTDKIVSLTLQDTLKDASDIFIRYGFRAIPILDKGKKILGVILYKDVMNLKHRFV